ncbi:MAG: hypothetical protein WAN11_18785 [Syntrophobacteraceae bacterium]
MKFMRLGAAILLLIGMNTAAFAGEPHPTVDYGRQQITDNYMPFFENRYETEHFIFKWTDRSADSRDNIADPQIIKDTAGYLETAWAKYTALFGRHPYTAPGKSKIEVVFDDIDAYGYADPPDGPIQFNAAAWADRNTRGIRRPTSAHELFHKMQYAYGYKTKWRPQRPYRWFSEGTAAWSEVYVWGMVSRAGKADELFKDTHMDLYDAEDMAMPFWIYFVQGNQGHPNNQLMRKFFEACERLRDPNLALMEVIKETYGPVDHFFKDFERERKMGFWSGPCEVPYKSIIGPQGKDLVKEVRDLQRKKNTSYSRVWAVPNGG